MIGGMRLSAGRLALFATAAFFVSSVAATPSAKAADLGGNCCVDLEERVAELEATTARKGNRRVSLTISGQVNTAIMVWDDGRDSSAMIVDNGVSRSGFNFDGSARINPNLVAGFQMVIALSTGARSHQTTQIDDDGTTPTDGVLALELANWYLDHKQLGSVRVGRINSASSGTTIVDLSGAGVIANANVQLWAGNFFPQRSDGGPLNPNFRWQSLMGGTTVGISSLSRQNAISYTTPTISGFSVQVAAGEADAVDDGMWDVALRYAGEFSGFRVAAAVSYGKNVGGSTDAEDPSASPIVPVFGDGADIRKWQGSASILHLQSGLFLSGAYVNQSYNGTSPGELNLVTANPTDNRPDTTYWYLLGGVAKNWTGMGNTVLYGEYGRIEDGLTGTFNTITGSEFSFWGLGVVQHIDAAAMELYLSYRQYSGEFDNLGAPAVGQLEDLSLVMGGARVRF